MSEQRSEYQGVEGTCPRCQGTDGHHQMDCDAGQVGPTQVQEEVDRGNGVGLGGERDPAEGNDELPPPVLEQNEVGDMLPGRMGKAPPTAAEVVGSDMLWLVARTCHEVNRAYCEGVMADHSQKPWAIAPTATRASAYAGVLLFMERGDDLGPEDMHGSWMERKLEEGWTFGNAKDEERKTHPNLLPYHQLHRHERAKDKIFLAVCRSILGG